MRRTFRAFRGAGRGAGVGGWVGAGVGIGAGVGATARVPDVEVDPCFGFATPFFFILHIPSSAHSVQLSHAGVEKQDAQQASELFVENVFSTTQPFCLSQSVEPANEVPAHCKKMPWDSSRAIQNTSAVNRILFLILLSGFSMRDARRQCCGQVACDGRTEPSSLTSYMPGCVRLPVGTPIGAHILSCTIYSYTNV